MSFYTSLANFKFWNIRWRAAIAEWGPKVGKTMQQALMEEAPYDDDPFRDPDKPHLRDQIGFEISSTGIGTEAQITFYGPPLAELIEEGAPEHEIDGNDVLHFYFAGDDEGFAYSVMHPGFDPNPFVERAYARMGKQTFLDFKAAVLAATIAE